MITFHNVTTSISNAQRKTRFHFVNIANFGLAQIIVLLMKSINMDIVQGNIKKKRIKDIDAEIKAMKMRKKNKIDHMNVEAVPFGQSAAMGTSTRVHCVP